MSSAVTFYGVHMWFEKKGIHDIVIPDVQNACGTGKTFEDAFANTVQALHAELSKTKTTPQPSSYDHIFEMAAKKCMWLQRRYDALIAAYGENVHQVLEHVDVTMNGRLTSWDIVLVHAG